MRCALDVKKRSNNAISTNLSGKQSSQRDSKSKAQDTNGHDATGKEKKILEMTFRWFVGFDGLLGKGSDDVLDDVGSMDDTSELDSHSSAKSTVVDVVVEVVKHAVGSIDLRVQLTNHGSEENHGKTADQKDVSDNLGKAPNCGTLDRSSGNVDGKHDKDDHELTSKKIAIERISSVGNDGAPVGDGVAFLVEFSVDRRQPNQRGLSSFDGTQPKHGNPQHDESEGRVDLTGEAGLATEDQTQDERNGENESDCRADILDRLNGLVLFHNHGGK